MPIDCARRTCEKTSVSASLNLGQIDCIRWFLIAVRFDARSPTVRHQSQSPRRKAVSLRI